MFSWLCGDRQQYVKITSQVYGTRHAENSKTISMEPRSFTEL
jgi:hypothetical protein